MRAHVAFAQFEQVAPAIEADGAAQNLSRRLDQSENRQRRHRLAAAGFADDAQGFAAAQLQADVIDRAYGAAAGI